MHTAPLLRTIAALVLAIHGLPATAAPQTILELPDGPMSPSARLRIHGSGFGSAGTVTINGLPALTTIWRSDEVHAYVPESTALGSAQVQVQTPAGSSNSFPFTVVPRAGEGRISWRFAISSVLPNLHGPTVGPDGRIYADDSDGRLYALSPSGELLWIYEGNDGVVGGGLEGPIDVAADGTIYYATNPLGPEIRVHAVRPDGTRKWMHSEVSASYVIIAGPNIGPDGNLYLVFDRAHLGTSGACSLDPNGNVRWTQSGSPPVNDTGSLGHRIAFGPQGFYVAFNEGEVPGVSFNHVFGFGYDGSQHFAVPGAWSTGRPHERADGSFVLRWGFNASIRSFDAAGVEQWTLTTGGNMTEPVVGPDGVTYQQSAGGPKLQAIDPSGAVQWSVQGPHLGWMNFMGVSPWGGQLLDGGRDSFGEPGWIRSYATGTGALEWSIDLPEEDPGSGAADLILQSEWAFDPASTHGFAMVNALVFDSDDGYGYLYAVDLAPSGDWEPYCFGATACPCANPDPLGGCATSSGQGARLTAAGSTSVVADDLLLSASQLPPMQSGLIYMGAGQSSLPFGDGLRCVGGAGVGIFRFPLRNSGPSGLIVEGPGLVAHSWSAFGAGAIDPGESWNFQAWFRDPGGPCGSGFNTSNGLRATFAN